MIATTVSLTMFVVISIASFAHFDPSHRPRGNAFLRIASLAGTACLAGLSYTKWPLTNGLNLSTIVTIGVSFSVFLLALRVTRDKNLHVAFSGDSPRELIVVGIYRYVRNPFYLSYILYWSAWIAATRGSLSAILIAAIFSVVYWQAAREEEKVLLTKFGEPYNRYLKLTGRFVPIFTPSWRKRLTSSAGDT